MNSAGVSAVFIKRDTSTEGNWIASLWLPGLQYHRQRDQLSRATPPSRAVGETTYTWAASTTDPRALQNTRRHRPDRRVLVLRHELHGECELDRRPGPRRRPVCRRLGRQGRSEQIQIASAATGAVLDTETFSNFTGGVYLQWEITGNVVITFKSGRTQRRAERALLRSALAPVPHLTS